MLFYFVAFVIASFLSAPALNIAASLSCGAAVCHSPLWLWLSVALFLSSFHQYEVLVHWSPVRLSSRPTLLIHLFIQVTGFHVVKLIATCSHLDR